MKKLFYIFLILAFVLSLSACSDNGGALSEPDKSPVSASTPPPEIDESNISMAPQEGTIEDPVPEKSPEPLPDDLAGEYYNDYLEIFLSLDGSGSYVMSGRENRSGTYSVSGSSIIFDFDGESCSASLDGDGDILFESMTGYFLRDWDKWDIGGDA